MGAATARVEHLLDLGRHAEALATLGPMLAAEPDRAYLHALAARAHLGTHDDRPALDAALRAVGAEPDGELGHRLAAIALSRLRRHREAVRAAQEAVRLHPDGWRAHQALAVIAVESPDDHPLAWQAADRVVRLAPNEPAAHLAFGLVAQQTGHTALARQAYERTLALDPTNVNALNNLTVLTRGARLAPSARGYGAVLRLDPQQRTALANVDALIARLVLRLWLGAVVALLVVTRVAAPEHPGDDTVTPLSIVLAAVVVVAVVGYVGLLARAVPLGIRRHAARRLLTGGAAGLRVATTGVVLVVVLVVCLVPGGWSATHRLLPVLLLAHLALLVVTRAGPSRSRARGWWS